MNTDPNSPIHPKVNTTQSNVFARGNNEAGLTKRELMAIEFTKATTIGIISASGTDAHGWTFQEFAKAGLAQADALIIELNKTPEIEGNYNP